MFETILAHAGHGNTSGTSLLHYLFEPAHLPPIVAGLITAVIVARIGLRYQRTRLHRVQR